MPCCINFTLKKTALQKKSAGRLFSLYFIFGLFLNRVAGEVNAEFFEYFAVYFGCHGGGVHLAAVEEGEAIECTSAVVVE